MSICERTYVAVCKTRRNRDYINWYNLFTYRRGFLCRDWNFVLLYGLYRGLGRSMMSIVLTILSLGSRVVLAYTLSAFPMLGVNGIWVSVPIGWALADVVGIWCFQKHRKRLLSSIAVL